MLRVAGLLALSSVLCLAGAPAAAQTPTPTPTATPTPTPVPLSVPATSTIFAGTGSGNYDAVNVVVEPDGSVFAASAGENVVMKIAPDSKKITRWTFPKDASPSSLLREPDGTYWLTELGGFKIAFFDPRTNQLIEWKDDARRPTSLVKRADGTFWLPETGGILTHFAPATGTLTYFRSTKILTLSYPYLDTDGSVWAGDFLGGKLVHYSTDASKATLYALPNYDGCPEGSTCSPQPSRIIRDTAGKLWISFYLTGELARFDPATKELKVYKLAANALPYDLLLYRDRIMYSDQRYAYVGFFDPAVAVPAKTVTLESTEVETTATTSIAAQEISTLEPKVEDPTAPVPVVVSGIGRPDITDIPAGVTSVYAIALDTARGRIYFGTYGGVGILTPPLGPTNNDQYFPQAASITGQGTARYRTQIVAWNRGTPDTTAMNARPSVPVTTRLLPNGWIAGFSPSTFNTLVPDQILSLADPIATEMNAPDNFGALRLVPDRAGDDLFTWARISRDREGGGTYGFARNGIKPDGAVKETEAGFLFTPPTLDQRTNAGFVVVESSVGTLSIVDGNGVVKATKTYDFPAGYHVQGSTIFQYFGIEPVANARVVFAPTTGRVMPFGVSIDPITGDPLELEAFVPSRAGTLQWLAPVARGTGAMGGATRTALQLHAPSGTGTSDANVTLVFRRAGLDVPALSATLTVGAGKVVSLPDALKELFGTEVGQGIIDVISDQPVFAFARVTSSDASGGSYGYGIGGRRGGLAVAGNQRGVFTTTTDNGFDVTRTDLHLANLLDVPQSVTIKLTQVDGQAGATRDLTLAPKEVRILESVWFDLAGYGTNLGRLDVVSNEAAGGGGVLATFVRSDRKSLDADAIVPYVIAK
ncbi:MAG: hypothetical protein JNK60_15225 [Acidobacteria bacterium]|nr:hypothetical protein [Acidobacteriota bacterium]